MGIYCGEGDGGDGGCGVGCGGRGTEGKGMGRRLQPGGRAGCARRRTRGAAVLPAAVRGRGKGGDKGTDGGGSSSKHAHEVAPILLSQNFFLP